MDSDQTLETIFSRAIEIVNSDERAAYLADACRDDAALRKSLERLVAGHFSAGSFMDAPALSVGSSGASNKLHPLRSVPLEGPGSIIGRYKLLKQIGEGGMGVVFMAEQFEPVCRHVAVKVIKAGMDSRQVIARFDAERQALARMDHQNVARAFDAGMTDGGRPYFVMELIKGVPITDYCDANQLSLQERLELFVPACRAIQHAHQKGIIHRDVKPSNVLVTLYDGQAVPKIIDFGVAKATQQQLTERTLFTELGQIIGTPEYMSPEQAEMNQLDVDTRSDVYSLGVLLYELLTGTTPITKEQLRQAGVGGMMRVIRECEPPRPSTRISESGEALPTISAVRKLEPAKLSRLLRGDLDWIAMKALEKDRMRRYASAGALAEDVERYLRDDVVEARAPSRAYLLQKFARRHKSLLAMLGAIAATLVVASIVSTLSAVRAGRAERVAKVRLKEVEQARSETLWNLYASRMAQAFAAWNAHDFGRLEFIHASMKPNSEGPDYRGWEWYFLDEQLRQAYVVAPPGPVFAAAWRPKKSELAVVRRLNGQYLIELWAAGDVNPIRTLTAITHKSELEECRCLGSEFKWNRRG